MPISFINPVYRDNIILAISHYQMLKPNMRLDEVAQCLAIVRQEHRSHFALRVALMNYLDSMPTGFYLFGVKSWAIKTGHSLLRTLISQALDAEQDKILLAYELAEEARVKELAPGVSREVLVEQNSALASKLEQAEEKLQIMEERMNESLMHYQIIFLDKERLEKKLTDAIWRADKLSVGNMELNHTLLALLEEKNALAEENKALRLASGRKEVLGRDNLLFERFGLPPVMQAMP